MHRVQSVWSLIEQWGWTAGRACVTPRSRNTHTTISAEPLSAGVARRARRLRSMTDGRILHLLLFWQVLQGHVSNVRGLLWHSEIPFLVVTGSWDATIRMWDVRTATCLKVRQHNGVWCPPMPS